MPHSINITSGAKTATQIGANNSSFKENLANSCLGNLISSVWGIFKKIISILSCGWLGKEAAAGGKQLNSSNVSQGAVKQDPLEIGAKKFIAEQETKFWNSVDCSIGEEHLESKNKRAKAISTLFNECLDQVEKENEGISNEEVPGKTLTLLIKKAAELKLAEGSFAGESAEAEPIKGAIVLTYLMLKGSASYGSIQKIDGFLNIFGLCISSLNGLEAKDRDLFLETLVNSKCLSNKTIEYLNTLSIHRDISQLVDKNNTQHLDSLINRLNLIEDPVQKNAFYDNLVKRIFLTETNVNDITQHLFTQLIALAPGSEEETKKLSLYERIFDTLHTSRAVFVNDHIYYLINYFFTGETNNLKKEYLEKSIKKLEPIIDQLIKSKIDEELKKTPQELCSSTFGTDVSHLTGLLSAQHKLKLLINPNYIDTEKYKIIEKLEAAYSSENSNRQVTSLLFTSLLNTFGTVERHTIKNLNALESLIEIAKNLSLKTNNGLVVYAVHIETLLNLYLEKLDEDPEDPLALLKKIITVVNRFSTIRGLKGEEYWINKFNEICQKKGKNYTEQEIKECVKNVPLPV